MITELEAPLLRQAVALLGAAHERTHDHDVPNNCGPGCEFPNVLAFLRDLIDPHPGRCDFCGRSEECDSARPGALCDVALPPGSWIPRPQSGPLTGPLCKCGIPVSEARKWVHDRGCEYHHSGSGVSPTPPASPEMSRGRFKDVEPLLRAALAAERDRRSLEVHHLTRELEAARNRRFDAERSHGAVMDHHESELFALRSSLSSATERAERAEAEVERLSAPHVRVEQLVADVESAEAEVAVLTQERDGARAQKETAVLRWQAAVRSKEARIDCHAGPGTTEPACGSCCTCLARQSHAAERRALAAEALAAERLEVLRGLLAAAVRMVDKAPVMGRSEAEAMDAARRALGGGWGGED